jgi:ABC-type uncharacterized transport system permease subunit
MLVGGTLLPLELYPARLQPVLYWLPFSAMIYGPARMLVAPDLATLRHLLFVQLAALLVFVGTLMGIQFAAWRRIYSHGG